MSDALWKYFDEHPDEFDRYLSKNAPEHFELPKIDYMKIYRVVDCNYIFAQAERPEAISFTLNGEVLYAIEENND